MPEEIQQRCRQADINSKSMLLQIVRQPTVQDMHQLAGQDLRRRHHPGGSSPASTRSRPAVGRLRNFTYRFRPDDRDYQFTIRFNRPTVEREELIVALRDMLDRLSSEMENPGADSDA